MAQMRRRRGLVVLYWILLIFSRCGLAVHVPMEGVSRICRQGDQQKKMPHAHGLLRLRGGTAVSSGVIPSDRSIREALSAAGPVAKSIPPALLRAVRDGRVGLEVIGRFAEWHQRLPRCLRWLLQIEMFRQRILADDNFIFKVVIEATLACVVQAVAEIQHRCHFHHFPCFLRPPCRSLAPHATFSAPVPLRFRRLRMCWNDAGVPE